MEKKQKLAAVEIAGKEYPAPDTITVQMYRQIINTGEAINAVLTGESSGDMVDLCLKDISMVYAVEPEALSAMPLSEVLPLRREMAQIIIAEVTAGLEQIPNATAAKAE